MSVPPACTRVHVVSACSKRQDGRRREMTCSSLLCTWCCLHSLHPYFVLHGMSGRGVSAWCGVCSLLSVHRVMFVVYLVFTVYFLFQFILALRFFTYVYSLFHACRIWCTMDKQIHVRLFTERFCSLSYVFMFIYLVCLCVCVCTSPC